MRIAITGATGFVGGRLAERLVLQGKDEVVGLVRRFSGPGLARLARLPVSMAQADLTDVEQLRQAFAGCGVVVHCAYGTSGTPEERFATTVDGTSAVLEAAAVEGVQRVVHISSTAVHGIPRNGTIDESTPFASPQTPYDRMKQEAENVLWAYHRQTGFPVTVLRPPLIYGPNGRRWTTAIIGEILAGATLVEDGRGVANFVHVDNLVDAIQMCMTSESAAGEAFVAVDDDPATWAQVYEGYRDLLPGAPPLRSMSLEAIGEERRRQEPGILKSSVVLPLQMAPRLAREATASREARQALKRIPWMRGLAAITRSRRAAKASETQPGYAEPSQGPSYALPDAGTVALQSSAARCCADKLGDRVGYVPSKSWGAALDGLRHWVSYQRLIDPSPSD